MNRKRKVKLNRRNKKPKPKNNILKIRYWLPELFTHEVMYVQALQSPIGLTYALRYALRHQYDYKI